MMNKESPARSPNNDARYIRVLPEPAIGRQAFLSTKFGLPLVDDDVVAACVVEPLGLDPDEDAEAAG
jgi:hypothetical protein